MPGEIAHPTTDRRPVLFVNPRSGNGAAGRAGLVERARERRIEPIVVTGERRLQDLVVSALADGAGVLGVAGGDGSVATVAAAACAEGLPFVCVPAGTRNHFALDLGIDPHDPVGALDAFDGSERWIDLGEVNGRLFVNNVSLGIYGDAVAQPGYRGAKLHTLLEAAEEVLGPGGAASGLRLVDDIGDEYRDPAVVLVSSNPYALERPLRRGSRPQLDGGRLGVVVLNRPGPPPHRPGRAWAVPRLDVDGPDVVHAGIDGEAAALRPPLRFAIRPLALCVRIAAQRSRAPRRRASAATASGAIAPPATDPATTSPA